MYDLPMFSEPKIGITAGRPAARNGGLLVSLLAVGLGFAAAGLLALFRGVTPWQTYRLLVEGAFACSATNQCNLLATLQFTTPLIFTGLAAALAMRAGLLSLGQSGQMVLGAATAAYVAVRWQGADWIGILAALAAAGLVAALWSGIAGALRAYLGVHEVLSTLLMNPIAFILAGTFGFGRVPEPLRLVPLVAQSKLTAGLGLALLASGLAWFWLQRTTGGFGQRMVAHGPAFARAAGVPVARSIVLAMLVSGLLAGLGGAVETLGVQYRFVTQFGAGGGFDGIAVGALAQLHPLGVVASAILLAGVRVGALTGLQIQADVPRELGSAIVAVILLVVAASRLYGWVLGPQAAARGGLAAGKGVGRVG
jgi:simple sugar transport system permease protein